MERSLLFRFFNTLGRLGIYILPFLLGLLLVSSWLKSSFLQPANPKSTETIDFQIESGWSTEQIAKALEEDGLINNSLSVQWLGLLKKDKAGNPLTIVAGEYQLSANKTPSEILEILSSGKIIQHSLTIPEAVTIAQVAELLAQATLVPKQEALNQLYESTLMANLGIPATSPEGYFTAGNYYFVRPTTVHKLATKIIENGSKALKIEIPDWQNRSSELGYSPNEIINLASIIEKDDDSTPEERKKIAALYHNRLRIGMRLESDQTLKYALAEHMGPISREQRQIPGPYNTWLNVGLPATPICSPSIDSIRAALYPEETDDLYFFKTPEGAYVYSPTLKEHMKKRGEHNNKV